MGSFKTTIMPHLKPKDGLVHVVMINSFVKWRNQYLCCDGEYTEQIDMILTEIQEDGYEIVDVKFNASISTHGMVSESSTVERYNTLIMYK